MATEGLKNVTLQQLEALFHLVAERSFSRAARRMRLTQPSLTKHIKNLEKVAATNVINRSRGGVSLTPEGEILFNYARNLLQMREQTENRILRLQDDDSGDVDISASTIPATYILPRVISAFFLEAPRIRLQIHTADSEDVLERVLNRQVDIGFIGKKPQTRKLQAQALWQDRLILAVPAGHPWQDLAAVPITSLLAEPFILRSGGSATRNLLETTLKEKLGVDISRFTVITEMGSSEAVKEAILAGAGVSILSMHAVARELRQGLLQEAPLEGFSAERHIYLIYRKNLNMLPHQEVFVNFVRKFELPEPPLTICKG